MSSEISKYFLIKRENKNSLFSTFKSKREKPFVSMHDCMKRVEVDKQEKDEIYIHSYGLKIKTHKESREKPQIIKEPPKRIYYDYFENHKDCTETQYYWKDIRHPKILRHISQEKKKSITKILKSK